MDDLDRLEDLCDESLLFAKVPVDVILEDEVLAKQKPSMPPQIKPNQPKATPKKPKSNAADSFSSPEHDHRKARGRAENGLTSTAPASHQLVPALSDTSIKEPSHDSVTTFLESPKWKKHQRQLKDWRRLFQDRKTRQPKFRRSASEPIALTTRVGARLSPLRRSSTNMISERVGTSHDDFVLDPWELEQRKKVLQRILKTANPSV